MLTYSATFTYTIISIILIVIIVIFLFIFYRIGKDPPTGDNAVLFQCLPGQCVTNFLTGDKTCPNGNEMLLYDPKEEVCNSRYTCENPRTPYASLSNGGTNILGICEPGITCRCLKNPQCPSDNLVLFNLTNGSISQNNAGSKATFTQTSIDNQGNAGINPLSYQDPNVQFCAIKSYHLNRLSPGGCIFNNPSNITLPEIKTCLQSNPCLIGVLAFYPKDINTFNLSDLNTVPLACVPAHATLNNKLNSGCGVDDIPVWDSMNSKIVCYSIREN